MLDRDTKKHVLNALEGLVLINDPWEHVECPNFLDPKIARPLASAFDDVQMKRFEKFRSVKPYKFSNHLLDNTYSDVTHSWQLLANILQSNEYGCALAKIADQDLVGRRRTLNMWSYRPGDLLGPHLDDPNKILTQVFYLSEDWCEGDGGRLAILTDNTMKSAVRFVSPTFGSSFIFLRSEKSWHAVEPIADHGGNRRSMTLTYWGDDPAPTSE